MINIVVVKNPFDVRHREILQIPYREGIVLSESIKEYVYDIGEFTASVNGNEVSDFDMILPDDAMVAVIPNVENGGGRQRKNPIASILTIALMLWTPAKGVDGLLWGMNYNVALMGVRLIGGFLINALFPAPEMDEENAGTTTYSWNGLSATQGQGGVIPMGYGTVKTAGQVIAHHVEYEGDKQYLCILACGGEGPVKQIFDIYLNDNPLTNFSHYQLETRSGINTQALIPFFAKTYADQYFSYTLTNGADWATHRTEGNAGQGLEIIIECPYGLYTNGDEGLETARVTLHIQGRALMANGVWGDWADYREGTGTYILVSDNTRMSNMNFVDARYHGGYGADVTHTWRITQEMLTIEGEHEQYHRLGYTVFNITEGRYYAPAYTSYGQLPIWYQNELISFNINDHFNEATLHFEEITTPEIVISACTEDPIRKVITAAGTSGNAGQYEVRMKCVNASGDVVKTMWTGLSHISNDPFTYPNKVLVGLRIQATDQISGSQPTIVWKHEYDDVLAWSPYTQTYVRKPSNNPAWACYDLIHRCRPLDGEYVVFGNKKELIEYDYFQGWADFCTQKSLTVNISLDSASELWTQLSKIESIGRGKVVMSGTRFTCVWDSATEVVTQMFTVGNIVGDFKEEFLSSKERANAIELTFTNKAKDYTRDVVTVYGDSYLADNANKAPLQLSLDGIDNFAQAYREAKFRLNVNEKLLRTVSFTAFVDSIACQVGDVISVQHDVPEWGTGIGGRLIAGGLYSLTLDENLPPVEEGKFYNIAIYHNDGSIEVRQVSYAGGNTVEVAIPFSRVPEEYSVYSYAEAGKSVKFFKVISITRDGELKRKIVGLEYLPEVYNEAPIPDTYVPVPIQTVPGPAAINGVELRTDRDGNVLVLFNPSTDPYFREYNVIMEELS